MENSKRKLKFRAWKSFENKMYKYEDLSDVPMSAFNEHYMNTEKTPVAVFMQYTGLKDKNGKECYEGDRLYDGEYEYIMVFEEGAFVAQNEIPTRRDGDVGQCEIIGNIYETKS